MSQGALLLLKVKLEALNDNVDCAILIDDELIFPRNIISQENNIWLIDKGSNLFVNGKKNGALLSTHTDFKWLG